MWLHGFTHTQNSGDRFRSILAGSYELLTIDLPGHGLNAALSASLDDTADLLIEALPDEPFYLGGYSLGARVALHVALRHRALVRGLVVLSATPGIADERARHERRVRDDTLAAHLELIGTESFLDEWLAQPLFATLAPDEHERRARSRNASGLAASLRASGTGTQEWLSERLAALDVATLVLSGALDEKFVSEGRRLASAMAHARFVAIDDVGHAAHLEAPERVAALIISAPEAGGREQRDEGRAD